MHNEAHRIANAHGCALISVLDLARHDNGGWGSRPHGMTLTITILCAFFCVLAFYSESGKGGESGMSTAELLRPVDAWCRWWCGYVPARWAQSQFRATQQLMVKAM